MLKIRKQRKFVSGLTGILIVCMVSFFAMLCCIPSQAHAQSSQALCPHCHPVKAQMPCHSSSNAPAADHCPMQEIVSIVKGLTSEKVTLDLPVVLAGALEIDTGLSIAAQHSFLKDSLREPDSQPLYLKNSILRL